MSNYKLVIIKEQFLAETVARTGSEQLIDKSTRSYVGLYNLLANWYIPLRANLGTKKPKNAYFKTPFKTDNPHFKNPGLDFEKAIYVPANEVVEIRNTLPMDQNRFIAENEEIIKESFEKYVNNIDNISKKSPNYLFSTVPLFPEGINKIKELNDHSLPRNKFEARVQEAQKKVTKEAMSRSYDSKLETQKEREIPK